MDVMEFVRNVNQTWPQMSKTFIIVSVVVVVLVVMITAVIEMLRASARRREIREESLVRFQEASGQKDLNPSEIELLREMVENARLAEPDQVFSSLNLFEQCVETELELAESQNLSEDETREIAELIRRIRQKLSFCDLPMEKTLLSSREISEGQQLLVRPQKRGQDLSIKAKALSVSEQEFNIKILDQDQNPILLKAGDDLSVQFFRGGDAEYAFKTSVLSAGPGMASLSHTRRLDRRQLRNDVRLEVKLPVKFRVIRSETPAFSADAQEAQMTDLSGGGMSFRHSLTLRSKDILSINFDLPTGSFRGVQGTVLRVSELSRKDGTKLFKHHVQFRDIDVPLREKIIRYIFEKQREESQWR